MKDAALKSLCEWLEDAVERQENLKAVCIAQGEAALRHDRAELEAKTAAAELLVSAANEAEVDRSLRVAETARALGLPEQHPSLLMIIAAAPAPWQLRLRELHARLGEVLRDTRMVVRENNFLVRKNLQRVNQVFQVLLDTAPSAGYAAPGATPAPQVRILLDTRG